MNDALMNEEQGTIETRQGQEGGVQAGPLHPWDGVGVFSALGRPGAGHAI